MSSDERSDLIPEEWASVPDFPDYEISNYARARSLKKSGPPKVIQVQRMQAGRARVKFATKGPNRTKGSKSVVAEDLAIEVFGYVVDPLHQDRELEIPEFAWCHRCLVRKATVHQAIRSIEFGVGAVRYSLCDQCQGHDHGQAWQVLRELPTKRDEAGQS